MVTYSTAPSVGAATKKTDIYHAVRKSILSTEYQPGTILNEVELAAQFGVSRTPVREAMLMLAVEKLIVPLPRAGYMVAQMSVDDILEAFHLREVLEVEAVGLAVGRIKSSDIERLHFYKIGVPPELNFSYNREFHLIIARASGNKRLARLVEQLLDEMERFMLYDPWILNPPSIDEHHAIIEALVAGDKQCAQDLMRLHIKNANQRILQRF